MWRMHKINESTTYTKGHQYEFIYKDATLYKEIVDSMVDKLTDGDIPLTILDYQLPQGKMIYKYGSWYPTDEDVYNCPDYLKGVHVQLEGASDYPKNHIIIYSGSAQILTPDGVILETI